jgi:hypothetical protein
VRIAIDCRELVGRPTGVGRYLSELFNAWGEMPAAATHEFVLCSPERVTQARCGNNACYRNWLRRQAQTSSSHLLTHVRSGAVLRLCW